MKISEKRKYVRYDSQHLLDYIILDTNGNPGRYSMGRTLDVCLDGLKLETAQPLHTDTRIRLTVGVDDDLIDVEGRTTHTSPQSDRFISGVSFSKVSKNGRKVLSKYLERLH